MEVTKSGGMAPLAPQFLQLYNRSMQTLKHSNRAMTQLSLLFVLEHGISTLGSMESTIGKVWKILESILGKL